MIDQMKTLRTLERLIEFAEKTAYIEHARIRNLPALTRLYFRAGMSAKSLHSIHAIKIPDQLALVDSRRSMTYAEADREINLAANALARLGVTRRTPVVIALENSTEYVILWFALLRLGARAIHASWRLKPRELSYILEHSGARVMIAGDASFPCARELQRENPALRLKVVHTTDDPTDRLECMRYDNMIFRSPSAEFPRARQANSESIVYTSGTTGKPKGAVRDLGKFNVLEFMRLLERLPVHALDRQLIVTPLYHSAAQAFALIGTVLGCTLRIEKHFDPEQALQILEKEKIHFMFAIPTMVRRMVEARETAPKLPELRAVISGSAEFPHAVREQAAKFFGADRVFDFYGATELGWVTLIRGDEMMQRKGSVGRALGGQEIAIFDDAGRRLPAGEAGKVYVRNEQKMGGYLNDSASTDALQQGNWMTVDDLGHMDSDGYLYLSGRARDMVKSGGVNIYPVEIEEVLITHPNIRETAVIGVPDKDWGERLVGVVVTKDGALDASEMDAFLRARIASYKIPKQWEVVAELPRNGLGKVTKVELRKRFAS